MRSQQNSNRLLGPLLLAVMILAPLSVLVSIPWLKQQPDETIFLFSGIAATVTVLAGVFSAILHDRTLDEWERSNARFSSQWGWTIGAAVIALLLALPPVRDAIVAVTADVADVADPSSKLVILAFTFGFGAVVLAQGVCTMLLAIGWAHWKSRAPREPS